MDTFLPLIPHTNTWNLNWFIFQIAKLFVYVALKYHCVVYPQKSLLLLSNLVGVSILIIISFFSLNRHAHRISFVHRLIMGDLLGARLVRPLLFLFFHFISCFYVSLFIQFISICDFEIVMWAQRYTRDRLLNLDRWMYALQSHTYTRLMLYFAVVSFQER